MATFSLVVAIPMAAAASTSDIAASKIGGATKSSGSILTAGSVTSDVTVDSPAEGATVGTTVTLSGTGPSSSPITVLPSYYPKDQFGLPTGRSVTTEPSGQWSITFTNVPVDKQTFTVRWEKTWNTDGYIYRSVTVEPAPIPTPLVSWCSPIFVGLAATVAGLVWLCRARSRGWRFRRGSPAYTHSLRP
ncbi:hypothetical protein Lxx12905 [Leifsonia xyli subsp. xyli str. CTCB07]|uniref:Uncharacterized protein n=1 Tax=Leifsonia xyli subsp. xyli (strain CTCB07) TaxID=281090 RepID=Q6AER4_LEIXX|nr:hypothetical protein [Leifsonia xyli]AAT89131.1 hypothetical protein Lxx12905 [Leifsonia xyli subsp. xyli str. CTCB07]